MVAWWAGRRLVFDRLGGLWLEACEIIPLTEVKKQAHKRAFRFSLAQVWTSVGSLLALLHAHPCKM